MRSLWFKQRYVSDILSGVKNDTYRTKKPHFKVGEQIVAQVGAAAAFAVLTVTNIRELPTSELNESKRSELKTFYDLTNFSLLYHISFTVQQTPTTL